MSQVFKNSMTREQRLEMALRQLLQAKGDHMSACDKTMGDTHPCTCGAIEARTLLRPPFEVEKP